MGAIYKDITGIILSGGKSSRMNVNKSLLKIGSVTFIERMSRLMAKVFENVLLSTNEPEAYSFLKIKMIGDEYKGHGPLSGIHAALNASSTMKNFIISCDLPLMSEEMVKYIAGYNSSKPIIIPSIENYYQYLCGVYNKSLLPLITDTIIRSSIKENGKSSASLYNLIKESEPEIIDVVSLQFYKKDLFFNMNSDLDYELIKNKFLL